MLATHHDQENLVALRQGPTKNRALTQGSFAPKTPGALYPKTPLKIPLNDENGTSTMGGKGVLVTKGTLKSGGMAKQSLVTPMGARRAPLGDKTTNAKARSGRPDTGKGAVAGLDKTAAKPNTTARRLRTASLAPSKATVLVRHEVSETDDETEIEYAPRPPAELPYESDVFPDGILTFEGLKGENLFRGYFSHYYNPVGGDGARLRDRELQRSVGRVEQTTEDFDSIDWSVSDVPETRSGLLDEAVCGPIAIPEGAGTTASKRAAATLPVKPDGQRKAGIRPAPTTQTFKKATVSQRAGRGVSRPSVPAASGPRARARSTATAAISRNVVGSAKSRSVSSMAKPRPASSVSMASITERPVSAGFLPGRGGEGLSYHPSVDFLSIFHDTNEDAGLGQNQSLVEDMMDDFELRFDD